MSVAELIGTIIGVLTFAGSVAGAIYAYGRLNERVKDHSDEIAEMKSRVGRAEDAARQVQDLATAVEHMGERFADQIKHLVETFTIETGHTRQQLADIKDEVRHVWQMSPPSTPTRRRRAGDA